jgi:imidazolonepropionase-like amidohydrolase
MFEVRDAQAHGWVQGARVVSCGWPITISGGHVRYFGGEADGVDGVVAMVRKVVSAGADFVKVMASGGGTPGSISHLPSYSAEELKAIVRVAHGLDRKVSAHCTNTAAIANAVSAGVDLIEHASFTAPDTSFRFDAEVARKVADAGIYVTPTLQVFRDMTDILPDGPDRLRWRKMRDGQREGVQRMRELGVRLLAGSDAGWRATTFDTFWKELDELVMCGLSPVEVIHAATGAVTQAFGYDGRFGTIRPGLAADLVAVDGDLAHGQMRQLAQVRAVFQAGIRVL